MADDKSDRFKSPESRARSLANLRPWTRETRPSNGGRRKKDPMIMRILNAELRKPYEKDPQRRTMMTLVVQGLLKAAARGNVEAAKMIFDRLCGRALTFEEMANQPPTAIVVTINRNTPRDFGLDESETETIIVTKGKVQ